MNKNQLWNQVMELYDYHPQTRVLEYDFSR